MKTVKGRSRLCGRPCDGDHEKCQCPEAVQWRKYRDAAKAAQEKKQ